MTTTLAFHHHPLSLELWRRLAVGAATLVVMLTAALTVVLVVGTTSSGSQPGHGVPYDPACAPTFVTHPC
jgi:hypothetical protein